MQSFVEDFVFKFKKLLLKVKVGEKTSYFLTLYQISILVTIFNLFPIYIFQIHLLSSWNTETYVCISPGFF